MPALDALPMAICRSQWDLEMTGNGLQFSGAPPLMGRVFTGV